METARAGMIWGPPPAVVALCSLVCVQMSLIRNLTKPVQGSDIYNSPCVKRPGTGHKEFDDDCPLLSDAHAPGHTCGSTGKRLLPLQSLICACERPSSDGSRRRQCFYFPTVISSIIICSVLSHYWLLLIESLDIIWYYL